MSDDDQYDEHDQHDEDGIRIPVGPSGDAPVEAVPYGGDDDEVKRVEAALYARIGEQSPEHRLTATSSRRRAARRPAPGVPGDPHHRHER
ncbi:hypothetical protein QP157_18315 [Sphingomonas sp. LR61]|uniref:hypothetical protein n=1 Tax=Sphingomonas sp. LR61 TaxID=3050234 RepID=UPI002FE34B88